MRLFLLYILAFLPVLASGQIKIISNLENQSIGIHEYNPEKNILVFTPGIDSLNTVAVWYSFGITGYRTDTTLTFMEVTDRLAHRSNFPAISYNNVDFERVASERSDRYNVYRVLPKGDTLYTATGFPYTYSKLQHQLQGQLQNKNLRIDTLITTAGGLHVNLLTINEKGKKKDKQLVWILCRQHAFESVSNYVMEGMINYLLSEECSKNIRKKYVFKIVPMVDVESVWKGMSGRMQKPRDFNRDWDNPVHETIRRIEQNIDSTQKIYHYHSFWDVHGTFPGGMVDFNLSYFDLYEPGEKADFLQKYWNEFEKISGYRPNRLPDNSYSYNGTPSDTWNMQRFPYLKTSLTLEVDWDLNSQKKPWTTDELRLIGEYMIRALEHVE